MIADVAQLVEQRIRNAIFKEFFDKLTDLKQLITLILYLFE